jgi:DNA-binding NarL/FixJ family response regulator/tetratricopeptide (TPR) repeat protein
MHGPLVGRERELHLVDELLRAGPGAPGVLVVLGDPGIGKTRLLQEVAERARHAGWRVAAGQASEYERGRPFAVVHEAVEAIEHRPDPGNADESPSRVRVRFERAAASGRLVLLLDDLHWADEASLEVARQLLRRAGRLTPNLLTVVAYRPNQVSGALVNAVTEAVAAGRAATVELGALDEAAVSELLRQWQLDGEAARLLHVTGGNPLYLTAVARKGERDRHDGFLSALPRDVAAALSADLEPASAPAREVARAAAVAGALVDPALTSDVLDLPADIVAAALDELCQRDILRPDGSGNRLRWRHPLLRHVVYEQAPPEWRRHVHARVASRLAQTTADSAAWVHHVVLSATAPDSGAAEVLTGAARDVAGTAPATAASWFTTALRLRPASADSAERARIELDLGEAHARAGHLSRARLVLDSLRAPDSSVPAGVRSRAALAAARVEQLLGAYDSAAAILRRELDLPAAGDTGTRSALHIELAATEVMRGSFDSAVREAQKASCLAAAGIQALAHYTAGRIAEAADVCERAVPHLDALSDDELAGQLHSAMWLGWAQSFLGRWETALRHQHRALEIARRTGQSFVLTHLLVGQGGTLRWVGRLAEARACYDEALDVAQQSGSAELIGMARAMQCRILTWLGDSDGALRAGDAAVALSAASGGWFTALARVIRAQARWELGISAEIIEDVLTAAGGPELPRLDPASRSDWYELLARSAAGAGHSTDAERWAARAATAAEAWPVPCARAFADLAAAHAETDSAPDAAAARAALSVVTFEALGNPLDAARARMAQASALRRAGRSADARTVLEAAEHQLADCGAARLHAECTRELRRVGRVAPLRVPASGMPTARVVPVHMPSALSAREREVAKLVAQGNSNRQIAAALFISEKTVERHMSNIFGKLGISSRTSLATQVVVAGG